ncbi:MAG: hypothetical protein LV481_17060 [Methylacidiphilales bacterium]|nr:hypothetical protein [Candidatus Methylacidiphilales bacterium]
MTTPPSPSQRPPIPQHVKRLRPMTYSVAVYLIGAVILLQIVMLISVFWLRAMVVSVSITPPKGVVPKPVVPVPAPVVITPPVIPKVKVPELPSLPSIESTVTRPALLSVPAISDKLTQIENLNTEAQIFQHHNDLDTAVQTLIKAEDLDPRNPTTLKSLAEVYYLRNNPAQSKIYWQRLVDLGPGVGTVYQVANDHVLLLNSNHEADSLRQPSSHPRLLYINLVEKTPVETLNGQPQFHLRTSLMRKDPKMAGFNQKRLQPYVVFYQQMPDGTLMPDLGQHKGSFEDTFLFWGNKESEAFGVDYIMPLPGTRGPTGLPVGEYYGFVIGIYYNKELQDCYSEPSDLSTRMPLPVEIE